MAFFIILQLTIDVFILVSKYIELRSYEIHVDRVELKTYHYLITVRAVLLDSLWRDVSPLSTSVPSLFERFLSSPVE